MTKEQKIFQLLSKNNYAMSAREITNNLYSAETHQSIVYSELINMVAKGLILKDTSTYPYQFFISYNIVDFFNNDTSGILDNRSSKTINNPHILTVKTKERGDNEKITTTIVGDDKVLTIYKHSFVETPFKIYEKNIQSPYLQYNSHTVNELLKKNRYSNLSKTIEKNYPEFLNQNIQQFVMYLVEHNDQFYKRFLNKNGLDDFCRFKLTDNTVFNQKGLYLYLYKGEIGYIGKCRDNFKKRFNDNYGNISPINCYKEGQSTNTHLNSIMNIYGENISIYLCQLNDDDEINLSEKLLLNKISTKWNRKK